MKAQSVQLIGDLGEGVGTSEGGRKLVNDGSRMAVYGALSVFSLELGEDVSLRTSF